MMQTIKTKQHGMTVVGALILLFFIAFFALMGIRLMPIYVENFKIVSALERVANTSENYEKSPGEIQKMLSRSLEIDDVESISGRDVVVHKVGNRLSLAVDYEVRAPLMANIDVLVYFKEQAGAKE